HANVAATLFAGHFLREPPTAAQVALIVGLAILMALLAANLGLLGGWIVGTVVLIVLGLVDGWALYAGGLLLPFTAPLLTGLATLASVAVPKMVLERRQTRALKVAVAHQALHDRLTGLANRAALLEQLGIAIGSDRNEARPCALVLLDLDRFKDVNDTLG